MRFCLCWLLLINNLNLLLIWLGVSILKIFGVAYNRYWIDLNFHDDVFVAHIKAFHDYIGYLLDGNLTL